MKEPRLKSVNRELRQWAKKIHQPGGTRGIGRDEDDTEDERNLAVGPLQKFMGNIAKIQKTIKRKVSPVPPQTPVTPKVKQSPQTPSTSKKPKLSFKTGSKAKYLLPKTPKQKTPKSKTKPKTPSPSFSTVEEKEEKKKKKISFNEAAKRAQERALKKIAPAPGWKPFGTPTKRKLDGKDWLKEDKGSQKKATTRGKFDLQTLIEKTGREFHIPGGYAFAGPGTKLNLRLKRGDVPKNRLDQIAKIHDIDYSKAKNLLDKWKADEKMFRPITNLPGKKTKTERVVKKIMQGKRKLKL